MNKNKQTNYAYAAGYVDGDGCFYIGKILPKRRLSYKFPVSIVVVSVNINILNIFKNLYGETIKIREEIIQKIHKLNLKGNNT